MCKLAHLSQCKLLPRQLAEQFLPTLVGQLYWH